jgi:hypothetical protein
MPADDESRFAGRHFRVVAERLGDREKRASHH